jgi:Flp pilus assembly protein TadD
MPLPHRLRFALACCLLAAGACHAQADNAQEIERLYRAGQAAEAMQRLERAITDQPRDAQLRFLKGVLLAESGKRAEAVEVYLRLTQEFPDLAEPFNNLAVLYAADGELDKARESLETALRNDPGYATAQENLGDVYVQLAIRSYERTGSRSPAVQRKLQLAKQLAARSS